MELVSKSVRMLRLIPFLFLLLGVAQAQDDQTSFRKLLQQNSMQAEQLYKQKEYSKAAALLEQLLRNPNLAQMEDERMGVLYNLACFYSLSGKKQKALDALGEAVAAGYSNTKGMQGDSDLDNIRGETQYKLLLAGLEARNKIQDALWNSPALNTKYRPDLKEDEKVAGLSRLWSEAKYNFAFFDRLPGLDWDAAYLTYLPKVRATKNTLEYYETLAEFYALLHDGHTAVGYPEQLYDVLGYPPISTRLIEGRVFIGAVRDPSLKQAGVVPGLEVIAVDGVPVKDYGNEHVAPRISASTPQDLARRTYEASLLGGLKDSPVELTFQDAAANAQKATLPRLTAAETDKLPRPPWNRFQFKMLAGGIAYVVLNTFSDDAVVKDFDTVFAEIQKSNALILDVRENGGGSSNIGYQILGYLTDKPFLSSQWSTRDYRPVFRAWGAIEKTYHRGANLVPAHSGGTPYSKPVVVLTSAETYSAAEDFAVAFDSMKRGTIIGEPTGGSTGQPLAFALPGGGWARVCSKHDSYPDGKEFVGVGVQPNVLVHLTISDFRAGRDTVLLAASEFLGRQK